MTIIRRIFWAALLLLGLAVSAQAAPAPVLKYLGQFPDMGLIHVNLEVTNWQAYPPAMFAPAPNLPPCGINANSSRTWVDIYNALTNQRIYGFCALGAPVELKRLWFATPPTQKPKRVYIIMTDRLTKQKYKSNIVAIP
jgi:hypothetical protein